MPAGAVNGIGALQRQQREAQHGEFFDQQQPQQKADALIPQGQAQEKGGLRQLVGKRVEEFAEVRHHAEFSRDRAVQNIAEGGQGQHPEGAAGFGGGEKEVDEQGNQQQTEKGQRIGEGEKSAPGQAVENTAKQHGSLLYDNGWSAARICGEYARFVRDADLRQGGTERKLRDFLK